MTRGQQEERKKKKKIIKNKRENGEKDKFLELKIYERTKKRKVIQVSLGYHRREKRIRIKQETKDRRFHRTSRI